MTTTALAHDPLWPRAGSWPATAATPGPALAALLGVPVHRGSLSPSGADATPAAVRAALNRYSTYRAGTPGLTAPVDLAEWPIIDAGDVSDPEGPAGSERTRERAAQLAPRAGLLIALGGDNSATLPVARGVWGERIGTAGLITLDAHHDLRDGVSNGSPVRELIEAGLDPRRIVQIGISDFANSRAYSERARDLGITVITRVALEQLPMAEAMSRALAIAGAAGGPIHVDLDVDVCDRAVAPGCPASTPGGISAQELRAAARAAGADPRVHSLDLVEVDATTDTEDGRTVRLVALCVLEALAAATGR
ncbi:arginase family protein [Mycetocola spongiae]|uniref:arginase family protein n=1 Tax=Mycetocola spongiae TaxID=2859226 RepID=UPI001CF344D6|nr:arginase family protein [Mycetocola spongiae]UCR89532.1 arginase family protein [Mycetocola spongiae]